MLVHAQNTIGMNIVDMTGLGKIAAVKNIVVDPESGATLALIVKKPELFAKDKIVSFKDIVEFYPDGILVRDAEAIVDAEEIVKVKDILGKRIFLIASQVITQNGEYLGRLEDFIFDTNLMFLNTIVVRKRFSQEKRIMSADRILSILPGKVIIRDIIERVKVEEREQEFKKIGRLAVVK